MSKILQFTELVKDDNLGQTKKMDFNSSVLVSKYKAWFCVIVCATILACSYLQNDAMPKS